MNSAYVRMRWGIEFDNKEGVDCITDSPSASLAILEARLKSNGNVAQLYRNGSFRLVLVEVSERVIA